MRQGLEVNAPPVEGAANDEVCRFLAGRVGIRRSEISILTGAHSRDKVVLVHGVSANDLRRALREALP